MQPRETPEAVIGYRLSSILYHNYFKIKTKSKSLQTTNSKNLPSKSFTRIKCKMLRSTRRSSCVLKVALKSEINTHKQKVIFFHRSNQNGYTSAYPDKLFAEPAGPGHPEQILKLLDVLGIDARVGEDRLVGLEQHGARGLGAGQYGGRAATCRLVGHHLLNHLGQDSHHQVRPAGWIGNTKNSEKILLPIFYIT